MQDTHIQYVHHSWDVWVGCTKLSDGCLLCHAWRDADKRFHRAVWGGPRQLVSPASRVAPFGWNKKANGTASCARYGAIGLITKPIPHGVKRAGRRSASADIWIG